VQHSLKTAYLLLEDGTRLTGRFFGVEKPVLGELVFNTGMTGYQEILTDPSYAGQVVVMTYPLVGNYGLNDVDVESDRVQVSAFIVKEQADFASNWRAQQSLDAYLKAHGVVGVSNLDTRMLTQQIRGHDGLKCLISPDPITDTLAEELLQRYQTPSNLVALVSRQEVSCYAAGDGPDALHFAVVDLGVKTGILKNLTDRGCNVTVFPWNAGADDILSCRPDAVLLSNGPGNPKDAVASIETARQLMGRLPLYGICLGSQILALALGADTYKLRFGHRGSNHPVQDLQTGKVMMTSQNHGYAVEADNLPDGVRVTHINVNDGTVEGLACPSQKVFSVQFHPEAGPGPRDAHGLFDDWIAQVRPGRLSSYVAKSRIASHV